MHLNHKVFAYHISTLELDPQNTINQARHTPIVTTVRRQRPEDQAFEVSSGIETFKLAWAI